MGGAILKLPAGGVAFIDGDKSVQGCSVCHVLSEYLCDYEIGGGKTCNARLCAEHAFEERKGRHLCPKHAEPFRPKLHRPACVDHLPPFDAVDSIDPKRPNWIRSDCRKCGAFLGYREDLSGRAQHYTRERPKRS